MKNLTPTQLPLLLPHGDLLCSLCSGEEVGWGAL